MTELRDGDPRLDEIWGQLATVTDPELDEPVTELGFVEDVRIGDDNQVEVDFRLPTYWCAINFAFLMVDDIRLAVEAVPWVTRVIPRLHDHMHADEINSGVEHGHSFKQALGDLAADEPLDDLRHKFRVKAFQRRQEAVLRALRAEDWTDADIVSMDRTTLERLVIEDPDGAELKPRYLQILSEFGFAKAGRDPAFLTPEGAPLTAAGLGEYLQDLRGVRINMEFNGAMCRGLLSTRYKEANLDDGEPTLVDFMLDRVPPRARPPT